jgi:16S rRNA (cytosine967-C5)-methyltransferase
MATDARALALRVLLQTDAPGSTLADELSAPEIARLAPRDRAFLHEIVLGTLRSRGLLDHSLQRLLDRPLDRLTPPAVLSILRLGAYQILRMRTPDHAAVSEAVRLARRYAPRASGLVNAVLRRLAREGPAPTPDPQQDPEGWLTTAGSLPPWLAARWLRQLGPQGAVARAEAVTRPPAAALRLNPRKPAEGRALIERLSLVPGAVPGCWIASAMSGGQHDAGTAYYVQDEGSQMVGQLAARAGTVIDLCSAPGGKSLLAADAIGPNGRVLACEVSPRRLVTLANAVARWGSSNVRCVGADALRPPFRVLADTVLLDAPCSGLGTLGRRPDVRWRRREAEIPAFAARQRRMLRTATSLVRPGGVLVYSVCSLEPEEGPDAVRDLLAADPSLEPLPAPPWAAPFADGPFLTRLPERDGGDGFFAAVLGRTA